MMTTSMDSINGRNMPNKMITITSCLVLLAVMALPVMAQGGRKPKTRRPAKVQSATVRLTDKGYQPSSLKLRRGVPARVTFIRQIEETCGKAIAIPEYNIRHDLPLNERVLVEFTPTKAGEFKFSCGMGMLRGTLIVQ